MSQNEIIAKRLSELRKEKGVKQDEIAELLNVKRATVANYETGKRAPDYETIIKLADYYGVSCDYILRGVTSEFANIHSTTGLSGRAIEILKDMNEIEDIDFLNLINYLIEETNFKKYDEESYKIEQSLIYKLIQYLFYASPKNNKEYVVTSEGNVLLKDDADENDLQLLLDNSFSDELTFRLFNVNALLEAYYLDELTKQIKRTKSDYFKKSGENNVNNP